MPGWSSGDGLVFGVERDGRLDSEQHERLRRNAERFGSPHGLHHGGLKGNEDRFLALEKLEALGNTGRFKKKKVRLGGFILAPSSTPLKSIPDVGELTWDDIERKYPVLRQIGGYVEKLMSY